MTKAMIIKLQLKKAETATSTLAETYRELAFNIDNHDKETYHTAQKITDAVIIDLTQLSNDLRDIIDKI